MTFLRIDTSIYCMGTVGRLPVGGVAGALAEPVEKMREPPQNRSRLPAYVSRRRFSDLHHSAVAFGLIVGNGNARIAKETQGILARCEPQEKREELEKQEQIVSGFAPREAPSPRAKRALRRE
jgi:hypothetical protein